MKIIKRDIPSHTQQPIDFIDEGTVDKERVTLSGAGASFQLLTGAYDGLEITDANGKVIIVRTDTVTSIQVEPAAATPGPFTSQGLKDLLKDTFFFDVAAGGGGEINTASNTGTGEGVFKQKTGVDLEFKSLVAGDGIEITNNVNDLTISVPAVVVISPPQITSNQDDYTPTGWVAADIVIIDLDADWEVSGFGAAGDWNRKTIINSTSAFRWKIKENDSSSLNANRVLCVDNKDYDLKKNGTIDIIYNPIALKWQLIGAKH